MKICICYKEVLRYLRNQFPIWSWRPIIIKTHGQLVRVSNNSWYRRSEWYIRFGFWIFYISSLYKRYYTNDEISEQYLQTYGEKLIFSYKE